MDLPTNCMGLTLPTPIIAGSSGMTNSVNKELLDGLETWMTTKRYSKLADFRGKLSQELGADPAVYERAQFMRYFGGKKMSSFDAK
jgi:hypothetical protein